MVRIVREKKLGFTKVVSAETGGNSESFASTEAFPNRRKNRTLIFKKKKNICVHFGQINCHHAFTGHTYLVFMFTPQVILMWCLDGVMKATCACMPCTDRINRDGLAYVIARHVKKLIGKFHVSPGE